MIKWIGRVFLIAGILCILGAAGLFGYNLYEAKHAEQISNEVLEALIADAPEQTTAVTDGATEDASRELSEEDGSEQETEEQSEEQTDSESKKKESLYARFKTKDMPTKEVNGNAYIGTLEIPELGLNLPVMEDWSYAKLNIAPCRYEGSAYRDNMVVCAHNYAAHFGQLTALKEGSRVSFTDTVGNVFTYELIGMEEVATTGVDEMIKNRAKDDWDLTLFTCNWSGAARNAFRFERVRSE